MFGQSANQGVDKDIEVLAQVVARLDHEAAVAIDEGAKVGGKDLVAYEYVEPALDLIQGAFFEIAQPQIMGVISRPALSDLFLDDAQL